MNIRVREFISTVAGNAALRRRLVLLLVAYAVITGVLAGLVLEQRVEDIASGESVVSAIAQLTEEQTTRTIQNVDQTLENLGAKLTVSTVAGSADEGSIRAELLTLLASRPFLKALKVLDRRGHTLYSSDAGPPGEDFSHHAYFIHHQSAPAAGFLVGVPIRTQIDREWILPASRSLRQADGELAGVIVANLDPLFFDRVWTVGRTVQDQATSLWNSDGVLMMRSPFDERAMGASLRNKEINARLGGGSTEGILRITSRIDGQDRIVAFRQLTPYPALSISVNQSVDRVLAAWRRTAWIVAAGWAIAGSALIWLAVGQVRAEQTRQATEDRYRLLFDASPHSMVVVDRKTLRYLAVNDAAVKQYGWSREEQLAMTANDFYRAEDMPAVTASRQEGLVAGVTRLVQGLRHRRKDGTVIDVEMNVRPIELDGRPTTLVMTQDVTERISTEKARLAMEEQLRQSQKMEAVGQLTGGIAHDFNNILTVILANADALQEDEATLDAATLAKRLEQITQAVLRASELTRQLLAFSRKQALHPQRTDINGLVTTTGKLLRRALGEQIEIDFILADDLGIVEIDRTQLETALVNLCVNARDAMPGGGRLLIETRNIILDEDYAARKPEVTVGPYTMLAVTDTGSGIPPETLAKVFEPFFTTKEVGKGTGLGLSMVYGFIKQSNGHIDVYSEVGHGTSIKLYLPQVDGVQETAIAQPSQTILGGKERLLVVEDDAQVRAIVVQQLRSLGYAVSEASDGGAGVTAFEGMPLPFDLLLTDVVMPGPLNGKLLAAEVARRWPTTRIVFMSGYTEIASVRNEQLDAGVLLLSKPFRKVDLAKVVRLALDGDGRPRPASHSDLATVSAG